MGLCCIFTFPSKQKCNNKAVICYFDKLIKSILIFPLLPTSESHVILKMLF